jgi:hypothetical protein
VAVHKKLSILTILASVAFPAIAMAASIDPSLIPDGTYTVKVDKVIDAKHIVVTMDNGTQATLSGGRPSVDFTRVKNGDQVKLSLIKGEVMVYLDLSSHS